MILMTSLKTNKSLCDEVADLLTQVDRIRTTHRSS